MWVLRAQEPQICANHRTRPSALWACGDQHGCGVVGVLTNLDFSSISRSGAVLLAGPTERLYQTPNSLSMYGVGSGAIMFGIVGWVGKICVPRLQPGCGKDDESIHGRSSILLEVEKSQHLLIPGFIAS